MYSWSPKCLRIPPQLDDGTGTFWRPIIWLGFYQRRLTWRRRSPSRVGGNAIIMTDLFNLASLPNANPCLTTSVNQDHRRGIMNVRLREKVYYTPRRGKHRGVLIPTVFCWNCKSSHSTETSLEKSLQSTLLEACFVPKWLDGKFQLPDLKIKSELNLIKMKEREKASNSTAKLDYW